MPVHVHIFKIKAHVQHKNSNKTKSRLIVFKNPATFFFWASFVLFPAMHTPGSCLQVFQENI